MGDNTRKITMITDIFITLHIKTRNDCKAMFRITDISAVYDSHIELSNGSMFEITEPIEYIIKYLEKGV